jgi:hypothetical protein
MQTRALAARIQATSPEFMETPIGSEEAHLLDPEDGHAELML